MRPLLTADVLNTCSQEYEEREEEMDTVIEKIFKKLNSCTTLELHFTVRCYHAYPCILSYIFTTMNCVLNTLTARYGVWLGFVGCTCVCVFGQREASPSCCTAGKIASSSPTTEYHFFKYLLSCTCTRHIIFWLNGFANFISTGL